MATGTATVDVNVENHSSIFLFRLNTDKAKEWVEDNVSTESYQWLGDAFAVEAGYARTLAQGMLDDGLTVE